MAARQTDGDRQTDRQMKQTQGPQRFAFCANQINTFNKSYWYQTAIQIYKKKKKKISQFTQYLNVQMLQKIVCNPGNKNTIKLVNFLKATFAQKPAAREVDDGRAKEESEKSCRSTVWPQTQDVARLRDTSPCDGTVSGKEL